MQSPSRRSAPTRWTPERSRVEVPPSQRSEMVALITQIENLEVQAERIAKVVVNERTGTIVIGEHVRIAPVAVAHGSLTVQITEKPTVSQPLPFSHGTTQVVPQTSIQVQEAAKVTLQLSAAG